ncbi:DHA2 family efflux MFS transporter permease subunit [Modestobacter sp. I12A-02628]|uniref:Multidrug efflux MFS transporter n=1 Tax=Goekera deserti TaxID=2497753 RepID=A0A7K3WDL2_9ACTN|nr:DHA2 family efflux MFS transporter permease subunit [Goekera deserti]MPQ97187.1 DHA2 family efflux MFS transporter permease subunit [Goekera deserti]NDI46495.1 DHA2 family efflux MFS transporter permease subunit [Goekera deserti]NEL54571.1 multidrug efflux MFS transporter [Goekera deserti]
MKLTEFRRTAGPDTAPPQPAVETAPRRQAVPRGVWPVAGVVVVGAFMTQLDTSLVNIGLATITADLGATLQDTQWIVSGYLLALVAGLPLAGWAATRLGAGRLWLWSLAGFTVASALCAGAPSLGFLVLARVLQGLAGGLLLPAGQTVIAQVAGREFLGRVMSVVGTPLVLGPALGPIVGGLLTEHASWPWLFVINVPVGIAGLWLGRRIIPPGRPAAATFDGWGFMLVTVGLPCLTFAVSRVSEGGGTVQSALLSSGVGVLAVAAFVRRALTRSTALLDLRLLGNRVFAAAAATSFVAGAVQIGALVLLALYFQLIRGYGVVASGVAMCGFALGAAVLPLAGRLTDRFGGGRVVLAGALLTTATFVPIALLPAHAPLALLEALTFAFGIGNALSVVPSSTAAYVAVRPPQMPQAVTQVNIALRLGGAVGAALGVSLLGDQTQPAAQLAAGFQAAFWCMTAFAAVSLLAAFVLVRAGAPGRGAAGAPPVPAPRPTPSRPSARREPGNRPAGTSRSGPTAVEDR